MDINRIIERLRAGEPISEIAAEFDMTWRELRDEVEQVVGSPAEDRDAIRERVRKGETLDAIAQEYVTSRQTIHRLTRDVGRRFDNRRGGRTRASRLSDRQVLAMRKAFAAGATQESLAAKYDMSPGAVARITSGATWQHLAQADNTQRPLPLYRTPEGIALAVRRHDVDGLSWEQVAMEFGVYRTTLRSAIKSAAS